MKWIRVRDIETGHQFDVAAESLRHGLEPLNDPRWPDLEGPGVLPRPALVHVAKDGGPPTPAATTSGVAAPVEAAPAKPSKTTPAKPVESDKE